MNVQSPAWLDRAADLVPFDVRPILAEGNDPFEAIMERVDGVGEGGLLVIDAPFNPSPLRRVLAGRGFSSFARKLAPGHWRVFFHKDGGVRWQTEADVEVLPEGAMVWREEDGLHIDVRKLPPPVPMLAILRLIDSLAAPEPIVAHHEREPHFLVPELAERGWRIAGMIPEFANIRIRLEHAP